MTRAPALGAGPGYRALLGHRRVPVLLGVSAAGRLGLGVVPLGVILLVAEATGSFGAAGTSAGAFALTASMLAPARGRLVDRHGPGRGLVGLALAFAVALAGLAWSLRAGGATAPVLPSLLAGAVAPPLGAVTKSALSAVLAAPDYRQAAYSLDTVLDIAVLTAAPALAGLLVGFGAELALAAAAGLVLTGSVGIRSCVPSPASAPDRAPGGDPAGRRGVLLGNRTVRSVTATMLAVGAAVGAVEVAVSAMATEQGRPDAAGYVLAALFGASSLAGLGYGRRRWAGPPERRLAWSAAALPVALMPLGLAGSLPALAAAVTLPGLVFGPALITAYLLVDQATSTTLKTEAMAWVTTAINAGTALGLVLGGFAAERAGFPAAAAVALALALPAAAVATLVTRRRRPSPIGGLSP